MKRIIAIILFIICCQSSYLFSIFERKTDQHGLPLGLIVYPPAPDQHPDTHGYGQIHGGSQLKSDMNDLEKPMNECVTITQVPRKPNTGDCRKLKKRKSDREKIVEKVDSLTRLLARKYVEACDTYALDPQNPEKQAARVAVAKEYLEEWLSLEEMVKV